jgi:diaminohydroxyphosphoribosylaminopyrimidine deaminase/5-amino-6-(5-phosphoribosylamino)uracil reductase
MHKDFLLQALELAKIRRGFCAPNPSVGAVVVKNGKVIATGHHSGPGLPHAEVDALNKIGDAAKGATIYVTLEPCCHFGKTPPCTNLLIERGVKQVIYGFSDPNPLVAGQGAAQLQQAGLDCQLMTTTEITDFYQSYQYWHQTKLPFVTAKLALSLDGKIAGENKQPQQITNQDAQRFTHQQRSQIDAILTTQATIFYDNPQLNVRLDNQIVAKPIYILDRDLKLSADEKIFTTAEKVTIFYSKNTDSSKLQKFSKSNIRCITIAEDEYGLCLTEIFTKIGLDGCHDLWIEAGGKLFQQLVSKQLVQRALILIAPKLLGEKAYSAFEYPFDLFANARTIAWSSLGQDGICEINF